MKQHCICTYTFGIIPQSIGQTDWDYSKCVCTNKKIGQNGIDSMGYRNYFIIKNTLMFDRSIARVLQIYPTSNMRASVQTIHHVDEAGE